MYRFIKSDFMRVAKENVCDMFDNSLPGRLMLAIIIIFIIIMPIIIYLDIKEQYKFDEFFVSNSCKNVEDVQGKTQIGIFPGIFGKEGIGIFAMTTYTPRKTKFICDGGVTYFI